MQRVTFWQLFTLARGIQAIQAFGGKSPSRRGPEAAQELPIEFPGVFQGVWGCDLHLGEGDFLRLEERERLSVDSGEVPQFDEVHATLPDSAFEMKDWGRDISRATSVCVRPADSRACLRRFRKSRYSRT